MENSLERKRKKIKRFCLGMKSVADAAAYRADQFSVSGGVQESKVDKNSCTDSSLQRRMPAHG